MIDALLPTVIAAGAIASWLMSGIFLAFSDFVMRSIGAIDAPSGTRATQSINVVVYRSAFMAMIFAMLPISAIAIAAGLIRGGDAAPWMVAGGLLYLVVVFGVTAFGNVPLNNALAALNASEQEAERPWRHYLSRWTLFNHIRTAGCVGAAVALSLAWGSL